MLCTVYLSTESTIMPPGTKTFNIKVFFLIIYKNIYFVFLDKHNRNHAMESQKQKKKK